MSRVNWILIGASILLALFVCAAMVEYQTLFKPSRLQRSYLLSTDRGIYHIGRSGDSRLYTLPTKEHDSAEDPVFCVNKGTLVYAPENEQGIVIARAGIDHLFIDFPREYAKQDWAVDNISTDNHAVMVVLQNKDKASAVLVYDIVEHSWATIKDAVNASLDPSGGGKIAWQSTSGDITITSSQNKGTNRVIGRVGRRMNWSYDFQGDTLYILQSRKKILVQKANKDVCLYTLPRRYSAEAIVWADSLNELWVPVIGPFSITGIAVFSANGRYLGAHDHDQGPYFCVQPLAGNSGRELLPLAR